MTVGDSGKRVTPAELLHAQQAARARRIADRQAAHKQAREWAAERAKHAIPNDDPAFWFVMQKLRADKEFGYKVNEPWCFKARLEIHLTKFHETTIAEQGHVVYYIKVGKYIKIGTSRDVDKRLNQYPPGSKLLATEPGGYWREDERHQQFAQYLAERKEWFTPGPELKAHIKNLQRRAAAELRVARHPA